MDPTIELDGKTLVIRLALQKPAHSSSGKSLVIATTRGTFTSEVRFHRKRIVVVANAFVYRRKKGGKE